MSSSVVSLSLCSIVLLIIRMYLCSCAVRDNPLDLELPNQWLLDIIDEFQYQVRQGS